MEMTQQAEISDQAAFYKDNGYLLVKNLFPRKLCANLVDSFHNEIKPSGAKMLRQASGLEEQHTFSADGYMTNALLDLHTFSPVEFPSATSDIYNLLSHKPFVDIVGALLAEEPVLIQTMYFESSDFGTLIHTDGAILDASARGEMVGCWVALEDISSTAGRFFISPMSNKLGTDAFSDEVNEMFRQFYKCLNDQYFVAQSINSSIEYLQLAMTRRRLINKILQITKLELYYPALSVGDVLFFSSKTLHGSDKPVETGGSRNSITAHFIPVSEKLVRFDRVEESFNMATIHGLKVHKSNYYSSFRQAKA